MPKKSYDKKERVNALGDAYDNIGKGGLYYMIDDTECKDFGFNKFVPKPGNVFLAILPRPDSATFFKQIYVHYDVGPNHYAFLCPNKMYDEVCPVCDRRKEVSDRGEPDEVVKLYSWSSRVLMWIVNVENKRAVQEGVYLYDAPLGVLKGIAGQTKDTRTGEIIDISDPVEDLELQFKRVGKDMHTKYDSYKTERRGAEIPDIYYDDPIDMVDVLIQPDVEAMEKALGISSGDTRRDTPFDTGRGTRDPEPRTGRDDDSGRDRDDGRGSEPEREREHDRPRGDDRDRGRERPRDDDQGRDRDDGRDRSPEQERPRDDDRDRNREPERTSSRDDDRGRNDEPFPDKADGEDARRRRIRERIEAKRKK